MIAYQSKIKSHNSFTQLLERKKMYKIVLVTTAEDDSAKIAEKLVEKQLAACVNILPVRSIYSWKGKVEDDRENLLIIKTINSKIEELKKTIKEIHSYEVPECIVVSIENGLPDYLKWIAETVSR
jgi:periplasmic divalent cation tolerance protein